MILKGPGTRSSPPSDEDASEKHRMAYVGRDLKDPSPQPWAGLQTNSSPAWGMGNPQLFWAACTKLGWFLPSHYCQFAKDLAQVTGNIFFSFWKCLTKTRDEDSWSKLSEISKTLMCLVSINYAVCPPPAKTQSALSFPKVNKWAKRSRALSILTTPESRGSWQGQIEWCCLLAWVCCALLSAEGPAIVAGTERILLQ